MNGGSEASSLKRLLVLAALVLFAFLAGRFYLVMGDDGTYIALARSLRAGMYRAINAPGAPPQTQYPPVFPLLLYPVANLPEGSVGVLRFWVACWSLLAVFPVARLARLRDPETGMLAALPFLVSSLFGEYSTSVMTESVFVMLAYAVLVRAMTATRFDPLVAAGLLLAWLMRSSGVALVAAGLLNMLLRRQYRAAAVTTAIVVIGMAPWWLWQAAHQSDYIRGHILMADIYDPSAGSLAPYELITRRAPYNLVRYVGRVLADVMMPPWFRSVAPHTPLFSIKVAASVLLGIMIAVGAVRKLRTRSWSAEDLYVGISIAMFLVHTVFADRYLYAILPSLFGYALFAWPTIRLRKAAAIALGAVSIVGCVVAIAEPVAREDAAYVEAVEWIDEHAGPDDVVLARKPAAVWFYTGRPSTGYPAGPSDVWSDPRVRYVIRDDYTIGVHAARRYLDPLLADTATFTPVFASDILPEVKIYRIHHGAANP